MPQWPPRAPKPGEQAIDLELLDESGRPVELSLVGRGAPLVVLVFRGLQDAEGIRLLREFRDCTLAIAKAGASICAIGHAEPAALRYLRGERGLGFPMLSDADGTALSRWGMLDRAGVFLLDGDLVVRQRALGPGGRPEAILSLLRRGGARRRSRRTLRERTLQFLGVVQHAFRPLRPVR
jgi:peroxiredoxin